MIDVAATLSAITFAFGAAWGGAKLALNGTKDRVKEISSALNQHTEQDAAVQVEIVSRLSVIESKVDDLRER